MDYHSDLAMGASRRAWPAYACALAGDGLGLLPEYSEALRRFGFTMQTVKAAFETAEDMAVLRVALGLEEKSSEDNYFKANVGWFTFIGTLRRLKVVLYPTPNPPKLGDQPLAEWLELLRAAGYEREKLVCVCESPEDVAALKSALGLDKRRDRLKWIAVKVALVKRLDIDNVVEPQKPVRARYCALSGRRSCCTRARTLVRSLLGARSPLRCGLAGSREDGQARGAERSLAFSAEATMAEIAPAVMWRRAISAIGTRAIAASCCCPRGASCWWARAAAARTLSTARARAGGRRRARPPPRRAQTERPSGISASSCGRAVRRGGGRGAHVGSADGEGSRDTSGRAGAKRVRAPAPHRHDDIDLVLVEQHAFAPAPARLVDTEG